MKLLTAQRQSVKIKLAIQGPSGSGKTYSSLLLAHGLCNDWTKIAVIDSENGSSNLYSSLGSFLVLKLDPPCSPERYIQAIETCAEASMQVIVIDGISPCWEFLLDFHSKLTGNSFTNWSKVTPRQQAFVQSILQADTHVICTMRTKQDYVLNQKDGKYVPEKVGLKAIQRDGIDYDFTVAFDLDLKHHATPSKDRTGLFMDKPEYASFLISQDTGKLIKNWCNNGYKTLKQRIMSAESMDELKSLYEQYKPISGDVFRAFQLQQKILKTQLVSGRENGI
jgi:hypothetical protein